MINTSFKIGDLVTNPSFCEYEPFRLSNKDFKGVTAKNQEWFDNLKACKNEKFTLKKLIEKIKDNKEYAIEKQKEITNSLYWTGYYDALGELVEFIEDNS